VLCVNIWKIDGEEHHGVAIEGGGIMAASQSINNGSSMA